jgi:5-methylcytosine-specific restriction endonuclease McrA
MNLPVLLLNANYAPLNVCTTKRALKMLISGKAEMLLNGRGYIRTVRISVQRPSVIRLGYMVKRPRPHVKLTKHEIFRRDNHACQYCGARTQILTLDHITPRYLGGEYSWENLVTACPECNRKKGGRMMQQARMTLRKRPYEPRATANYLYGSHVEQNDNWGQFLEGW